MRGEDREGGVESDVEVDCVFSAELVTEALPRHAAELHAVLLCSGVAVTVTSVSPVV
jgi:hypothetical protein